MPKKELIIAPAGEALLIFVAAAAGWATHQPLIFASLGPTAYELIETPHRRSAEPYSLIVGHLAGVGSACFSLFVTHAWSAPPVSQAGVPLVRVGCTVLAAALTVLINLLLRASQPAAISTALLIAVGMMQKPHDVAVMIAAVLLMAIVGEPLRRIRLRGGTLGRKAETGS